MKRQMIMLENLNCPVCASKIEKAAQNLPGMREAKVSFGTGSLTVEYDESVLQEQAIRDAIQKHGVAVATVLDR